MKKKFYQKPAFWIVMIVLILIIVLAATSGSGSSGKKKAGYTEGSSSSEQKESGKKEDSGKKSDDDYASQVTADFYSSGVDEYGTSHAALVVTNNSKEDLSISANFTAKDASGNAVGSASDSEECVAAGQQAILIGYFDNASTDSTYDYSLSARKSYTSSANDSLNVTANQTADGVVFSATNNGTKDAYFVEGRALFFKGGQLVDADFTYMINENTSALQPGQTLSSEVSTYTDGGFDSVITAYTSRTGM